MRFGATWFFPLCGFFVGGCGDAPDTSSPPLQYGSASPPAQYEAVSYNSLLEKGDSARNSGNFVEAAYFYKEAQKLDASLYNAYYGLALVALDRGDADDAVVWFDKAIENGGSESLPLVFSQGRALYKAKEYNRAIELYESYVSRAPDSRGAWYNLGLARSGEKKFAEAAEAFREALRLSANPGDTKSSRERLVEALVDESEERRFIGDYVGALQFAESAMDADPETWQARAARINAMIYSDRAQAARDDLDWLRSQYPDDPYINSLTGYWLASQNEIEVAQDYFERAAQEDPDEPGYSFAKGRNLYVLGRYAEAERAFAVALDLFDRLGRDPAETNEPYALLWHYLAAERVAAENADDIATAKARATYEAIARPMLGRMKSAWPAPILEYFREYHGPEINELERLASEDPLKARERRCEVYFYYGAYLRAANLEPDARFYFERAVATGVRHFVEYQAARAALNAGPWALTSYNQF